MATIIPSYGHKNRVPGYSVTVLEQIIVKLDQVAVIMTDGHTQSMTVSMCFTATLQTRPQRYNNTIYSIQFVASCWLKFPQIVVDRCGFTLP